MTTHRKELGARKHVRIDLHKPAFLIPAPDAPWIECLVVDVSETGVCLEVGSMAVPKMFGLAFTSGGEVLRVCSLAWRRGEQIGARFVTAKELRQGLMPNNEAPKLATEIKSERSSKLTRPPAIEPQQPTHFME